MSRLETIPHRALPGQGCGSQAKCFILTGTQGGESYHANESF